MSDKQETPSNIVEENPHTSGGIAICTAANSQIYPQLCSDGDGGAIITWYDDRSGTDDIYAQRINATGDIQWTANGVAICTASNSQTLPQICRDGVGGAIITWNDLRNGGITDIYAQRVNATGHIQWDINGVEICTETNYQENPQICGDNAEGAIITWADRRSGADFDIYAQRVNSTGGVNWTGNGIEICGETNDQDWPQICSDGAGGAIITWEDSRSGTNDNIYAQRINTTGGINWTLNGIDICTVGGNQKYPEICSDIARGAIITWADGNIHTQKVNETGDVQWNPGGIEICGEANEQWAPKICSDGAGGAIITWADRRGGSYDDVYAQRINATGGINWTLNGVGICTNGQDQDPIEICSDGAGGAFITWEDERGGTNDDIYAQRVNSTGGVNWTADGIAILTSAYDQNTPQICSDDAGGAIITWSGQKSGGNSDIYAQKLNASGDFQWTSPASSTPPPSSVSDDDDNGGSKSEANGLLFIILLIIIIGAGSLVFGLLIRNKYKSRKVEIPRPESKKEARKKTKHLEIKKEIKKIIIDLGTKFPRLHIMDIGEKAGVDNEKLIIDTIQEMIKNNEINAEYFKKSKSVAFDKQAIIDEIDKLMESYKEWEEKGKSKK